MQVEDYLSEITVTAYSKRYKAAVRDVLGIEGGYVNDRFDAGGATKYGISLRYLATAGAADEDLDGFADFDLDMDGDIDAADIRKLTKGDAIHLYHRDFWKPLDCGLFPVPIGEMLFDQAINGGATAAKKMVQTALNAMIAADSLRMIRLVVDGKLGPRTMTVFASLTARRGEQAFVEAYREAAKDRYLGIVRRNPSQARFLKGWLRRADALGRYAHVA